MVERFVQLAVNVRAPVRALDARRARITLLAPFPLLRILRPNTAQGADVFAELLARWGWEWACTAKDCWPSFGGTFPNQEIIFPREFDPRPMVLAALLGLKLNGHELDANNPDDIPILDPPELEASWRALQSIAPADLGDVLSLALFEPDGAGVFDFTDLAPNWTAEVKTVCLERQPLPRKRHPAARWLADGYTVLYEFAELRIGADSIAHFDTMWELLDTERSFPASLHLAWWWEATYILSERQRFAESEVAEARLAGVAGRLSRLSGLVDPLWNYQRSRLCYYNGLHGDAIGKMMRQLHAPPANPLTEAMLCREAANVLSDLGCLEAAARLIRRSITSAREQGNDGELFKSQGRHGEILIKMGDPAGALNAFTESLSIQRRQLKDGQRFAQTLSYLGHTSIMMSDYAGAVAHYNEAERADESGTSKPYITMGRFALALRTSDTEELNRLWVDTAALRTEWLEHVTNVLCGAVCCTAAALHVPEARSQLARHVVTLINSNYAIESLYAFSLLPESQAAPLAQRAAGILNGWQRSLKAMPRYVEFEGAPLNAPAWIAGELERCRRRSLPLPAALLSLCYPMTLLGSAPPALN